MITTTIDEILNLAEKIEKLGLIYYEKSAENCNLSQESSDLLNFLKNEEAEHAEKFSDIKKKLDNKILNYKVQMKVSDRQMELFNQENFMNKIEKILKSICNSESEYDIIKASIKFEKETYQFYKNLSEHLKSIKLKNIIDKLAEEELEHVNLLNRLKVIYR